MSDPCEHPTPLYYRPNGRVQFAFDGVSYDLQPGVTVQIPSQNVCVAWNFTITANNASGAQLTVPKGAEELVTRCCKPNDVPRSQHLDLLVPIDSSYTGINDGPVPSGEDTAGTLLAPGDPTVNDSLTIETLPGLSDGRSLTSQYFDQENPMPEYSVLDHLQVDPEASEDLQAALRAVLRNEPAPGLPHVQFGRPDRSNLDAISDPVLLFTGQYALTHVDFELRSRSLPFRFVRTYRSGAIYFGPWGYNWDHSYNVYLRPLNDGGAAIWTGRLTEDVYVPSATGFEPPTGTFLRLAHEPASIATDERYTLTDREGLQQIFTRPPGWPRQDRLPLTRLEDRWGNAQVLTYDAGGRLVQIADLVGQWLRLTYGECDLVETVTDHAGRTWRYVHDLDVEDLVATISPATPDFPEGVLTQHEYDREQAHPALRHNLVRVFDARGRVLVENVFGTDPASDDFGCVVHQEYGGITAEHCRTVLRYVPRVPDAINVAAKRVEVLEAGVLKVFTFNYRGDLLEERLRLVRDGSYRLVVRRQNYDTQGNLVERRDPDGTGLVLTYDHDHVDPRARGNLLAIMLDSSPLFAVPSRTLRVLSYEPAFHRLKAFRDELGRLTTWTYDYEVGTGARGDVVRIDYPACTLPDGTKQPRSEHYRYDTNGQLAEHVTGNGTRHVFTYSPRGYLSSLVWDADRAAHEVRYEYDARGYRTAVIDALGRRQEVDTNDLGQVIAMRVPAIDGAHGETRYEYGPDGLIVRVHRPRGAYTDDAIVEPFLTTEVVRNTLGHITKLIEGANTARPRVSSFVGDLEGRILVSIDPAGARETFRYDERGLLLRHEVAASTSDAAVRRYRYTRNGALASVVEPDGLVTTFEHDAWGRVRRAVEPGGTAHVVRWGPLDLASEVRTFGDPGDGTPPRELTRRRIEHDERGRVVRFAVAAFGDPDDALELVTVYTHDADGYVVEVQEPRGGVHRFRYDGLGRLVDAEDLFGNRVRSSFDTAGDLVERRLDEPTPAGVRTSIWTFEHDARRRLVRTVAPHGATTERAYDDRDELIELRAPNGLISRFARGLHGALERSTIDPGGLNLVTRAVVDALDRPLEYIDPMGEVTRWTRDTLGRVTRMEIPNGAAWTRTYTPRGSVATDTTPGGTQVTYAYDPTTAQFRGFTATAPAPIEAVASHTFECDGLGRVVRAVGGAEVVVRIHDSLGRLREERIGTRVTRWQIDDVAGTIDLVYPDGRIERTETDVGGRPTRVALVEPGALGGGPGTIASLTYDSGSRVTRIAHANGVDTEFVYDDGRRVTEIAHRASGATLDGVRYAYDVGGRRRAIARTGALGEVAAHTYDARDRWTGARAGFTAALEVSTTQAEHDAAIAAVTAAAAAAVSIETVAHDAADARVAHTADGVTTTYVHGPGHRTEAAGTEAIAYHPDGHRKADVNRTYDIDALGRVVRVRDAATAEILARFDYDPFGRLVAGMRAGVEYQRTFDGARRWIHESAASTPLRQRTPGIGTPLPLAQHTADERAFVHADGAASVLCLSDDDGTVLERARFDAFGRPELFDPSGASRGTTSACDFEPIFGGMSYVPDTDLYRAQARLYDPHHGEFLARDPALYHDSASPYAYCRSNPVDFIDPDGEWLFWAAVGLAALIGGVSEVIHGGDALDIVMGGVSGGVGAAISVATRNPFYGGAVGGGLMGCFKGIRYGVEKDDAGAAFAYGAGGLLFGAGLGAATAGAANYIGNSVATTTSGWMFRALNRPLLLGANESLSWNLSRGVGMITGGYVGTGVASTTGNLAATAVTNSIQGRPFLSETDVDSALFQGLAVDGPLGAVGALGERVLWMRSLNNSFGAEGEELVARFYNIKRGGEVMREGTTYSGYKRTLDFLSYETVLKYRVVLESKNAAVVFSQRGGQLMDFAVLANEIYGVPLRVHHRPGAMIDSEVGSMIHDSGEPFNVQYKPIPQQPLTFGMPMSRWADGGSSK